MSHPASQSVKHSIPNTQIEDVIAYGSMSVVRRAIGASGTKYAVKIIKVKGIEHQQEIKKEMAIHKALIHKHVVRLRETYFFKPYVYFLMDYADNGELFVYIDPGKGIAEDLSHLYLKQLLCVLRYMHIHGICHRDIKPENILLDKNYNLLLADFGCSTLYKDAKGQRMLTKSCGSLGYMAPDIFYSDYNGEMADVWSFGILALVMWTGTIPWECARIGDPKFERYKISSNRDYSPFNCLSAEKLEMIEHMLAIDPSKRAKFSDIEKYPWFLANNGNMGPDGLVKNPSAIAERLMPPETLALSQPTECITPTGRMYSSQPVFVSYNEYPSATRIYVCAPPPVALKILSKTLSDALIQHKMHKNSISFNTVDAQKNAISGEILCRSIRKETMLIFQKTRGNCLEFKKMFNIIRDNFIESADTYYKSKLSSE